MKQVTVELLACPECGGELRGQDAEATAPGETSLACANCGARYTATSNSVRLLPRLSQDGSWSEWNDKQELGLEEYEVETQSEAEDPLAERFGEFAGLHGVVLDIGCGIGAVPSYARSPSIENYVGLDPLDGERKRGFDFIQGVGEQLPIQSAALDCVVSATSLDHVVDAERVVAEARRVLKPDGAFALWIAVADEETLVRPFRPRLDPAAAYEQGGVRQLAGHCWNWAIAAPVRRFTLRRRFRRDPEGVVRDVFADRMRYHFHFFRPEQVEGLLTRSGFAVKRRQLVRDVTRGSSLFVLATPCEDRT
jgi:SAM-dependent methyltransferase